MRRFRELPPCVLTGCGPVQEATPVQLTHVDASGRAAMVDVGQARPLHLCLLPLQTSASASRTAQSLPLSDMRLSHLKQSITAGDLRGVKRRWSRRGVLLVRNRLHTMQKRSTERVAVASGRVLLGRAAFELVAANAIKKGDVLTVAQVDDLALDSFTWGICHHSRET